MARRLGLLLAAVTLAASTIGVAHARTPQHHTGSLTSITLGMGYVPSVQFAPFYLADQLGYYRQAGIKVNFNYASSPNLLQLVAAGKIDFAIADGTDVIAARANNIPVTSVMTLFRRLPTAVFALRKSHIKSIADLRGKSIGIPGPYGSTYAGLLAALHLAGLKPSDVTLHTIGYTQAESVVKGTVDAAVGYSNNEPLLLKRRGYKITTLQIGKLTNLIGPGVAAGPSIMSHNPALVRRFVNATLRGLATAVRQPRRAFAAARRVPGLSTLQGRDVGDQYAVLLRTRAFWHDAVTRTHGLGYADPAIWSNSLHLLQSIGQVPHPPRLQDVTTNRFVVNSPRA